MVVADTQSDECKDAQFGGQLLVAILAGHELVVLCHEFVDFGNEVRIDIQERLVEVLVEHADAAIQELLTFQFGIEVVKLAVACQTVQVLAVFLSTLDEVAAQLQKASDVLILDAVDLLHLVVGTQYLHILRCQFLVHLFYLLAGCLFLAIKLQCVIHDKQQNERN